MAWKLSCSALRPGVLMLGWHRAEEAQGECLEGSAAGGGRGAAPSLPPSVRLPPPHTQYDQRTIAKACGKDVPMRLAHCRCTMEVRLRAGPLSPTQPVHPSTKQH